jgi:hypothetical protein
LRFCLRITLSNKEGDFGQFNKEASIILGIFHLLGAEKTLHTQPLRKPDTKEQTYQRELQIDNRTSSFKPIRQKNQSEQQITHPSGGLPLINSK